MFPYISFHSRDSRGEKWVDGGAGVLLNEGRGRATKGGVAWRERREEWNATNGGTETAEGEKKREGSRGWWKKRSKLEGAMVEGQRRR